jgi:hypothetical protein
VNATQAFSRARIAAETLLCDDVANVYAAITDAADEGRVSLRLTLPNLLLPTAAYRINGLVRQLESDGYIVECPPFPDDEVPYLVVRWGDTPQSVRSLLSYS